VTFAILMLTSCGRGSRSATTETLQQTPQNLQELLDIAYIRRLGIYTPGIERLAELTYGRVQNTFDMLYDWNGFSRPQVSRLTAQNIMHDVQLFFDILREVYAAYTYFGGDEVFLPIFDEILGQFAYSTQVSWAPQHIASIVHDGLRNYIHDHHLSFGGRGFYTRFTSNYGVFASFEFFDRTENGFRNRSNGLYVKEVIEHDINEVFRLTITQYGEFMYTPVVEGRYNQDEMLTIIYETGESVTIKLYPTSDMKRQIYQEPSLEFIDGFPVITISRMYLTHHSPGFPGYNEDAEHSRTFLSFVDKVRDEPAIIIDLRGNPGGSSLLPTRWLYYLTGEIISNNSIMLTPLEVHNNIIYAREHSPDIIIYPPSSDEIHAQQVIIPFGDNHVIRYNIEPDRHDTVISNEQIIIFLSSRHSGSASEVFINMGFNLENTLVIGQNTQGTLVTGLCFPNRFLPYTGIGFDIGSTLFVHADTLNFREGVGIAPDLWIPHNEDALLAALALLRNHFGE